MGYSALIYRGFILCFLSFLLFFLSFYYHDTAQQKNYDLEKQFVAQEKHYHYLERKQKNLQEQNLFWKKNPDFIDLIHKRRLLDPPLCHELERYLLKKAHEHHLEITTVNVQLKPFIKSNIISVMYDIKMTGKSLPDTRFYQWLEDFQTMGWGHMTLNQCVMGRMYDTTPTATDFQVHMTLTFFEAKR